MRLLLLHLVVVSVAETAKDSVIPPGDDLTKIPTVRESSNVPSEADILIIPFAGSGASRLVLPTDTPANSTTEGNSTTVHRTRREAPVTVGAYCKSFRANFDYFCPKLGRQSASEMERLEKFCKQYSDFCVQNHSAGDELPEIDSSEVHTAPRKPGGRTRLTTGTSDEASQWADPNDWEMDNAEKALLKARRRHPCTPECNVNVHPHCTHDCKCEYDKPRIMRFCTGPLDREDLRRCQHWFRRCPRQSPFHRRIYDAAGRIWPGMEGEEEGLRRRLFASRL